MSEEGNKRYLFFTVIRSVCNDSDDYLRSFILLVENIMQPLCYDKVMGISAEGC